MMRKIAKAALVTIAIVAAVLFIAETSDIWGPDNEKRAFRQGF